MKSGLRDRNNAKPSAEPWAGTPVSMKSGLRDRNNLRRLAALQENIITVSMKSGLRDRNNQVIATALRHHFKESQ